MPCKICREKEKLAGLDAEALVAKGLAVREDLALEQEIDRRLYVCENCSYLSGHTCLKCGCFIKYRASISKKKCPLRKW